MPLHLFLTVADAVLGIPTSNYDNNQHGPDENLRIGNLFDAINRWATILGWQLGDTRRSDGPLEVGIEADVITRVHRTPRTCSGANSSGCS